MRLELEPEKLPVLNYQYVTKAASPIRQTQSGVPELILVLCLILLAGLMLL